MTPKALIIVDFEKEWVNENSDYFVGNISNINKEIFDKEFVKAFESNYRVKELLKKTPIYLVLNTNIGLLGAGFFCAKGL